MENILNIVLQFGGLLGVAAAIAAVINVLKTFGLVKDGDAGKWSAALNLLAMAALIVLGLFAPQFDFAEIDAQAKAFAEVVAVVLGYVVQLGFSVKFHDLYSRAEIPLIGKSYGDEKWAKEFAE